jgi:HK97 family phage prohead protease
MSKKYNFSGYATKFDVLCTDGRVIKKDAFKHQDKQTVPLVWQHEHNSPENVLGHATLEYREDGIYAYGYFNDTAIGQHAQTLVEHGDIKALSIFANQLQQTGSNVMHGNIREVSLVYAGANVGAYIENVELKHSDGTVIGVDETSAIIYSGEGITHDDITHSDPNGGDETVQDVLNTLDEKQKNVVYALIAEALGKDDEATHSAIIKGGKEMKQNVFNKYGKESVTKTNTLTHAQFATILADAQKNGSFKEAILAHAVEYGIENIDVLFPDAQTLRRDPDWLKREDGWVSGVLTAIGKSPFSRIKSVISDMDIDTARAKGYITGTEKKEVYFKASKRETTPTTVYVKQKIDNDDINDVTDFDVVGMIRFQLRTLLDEELATAALVGDGRDIADPYKINEEKIRPIWKDDDIYAVKEKLSTKTDYDVMIEEIALSGERYKGSGSPTLYTTNYHHMKMLWVKDTIGRRIYESDATLCAALGVSKIVEVPILANKIRVLDDGSERELIGIKINLRDYNIGADKGGQIASFDNFDIDFNQYKYLMETRCSGTLTKPKSAQIFEFETKAAI